MMDIDQGNGAGDNSKRRKLNNDGFLDCGSVSWSILLAIFFLSLHKGQSSVVDADEESVNSKLCINFESCLEMLEVLTNEFGDMIPLETATHVLEAQGGGCLT